MSAISEGSTMGEVPETDDEVEVVWEAGDRPLDEARREGLLPVAPVIAVDSA
jgi:hypothetical protein